MTDLLHAECRGGPAADGGRCWRLVIGRVHGVPVCADHADDSLREARQRARHPSGAHWVKPAESVVYYLGDPERQLIKIGTSSALRHRISDLRRTRPALVLLATEPGTHPTETRRHREFAHLREWLGTGEREWFRKVPQLMTHIAELRQAHGLLCPGPPVWIEWIAPLRIVH